MTPLHWLAQRGRISTMKRLLKHKDVNVNAQTASGETPLHYAVLSGNTLCLKILLSQKEIDPNLTFSSRQYPRLTPLHLAISLGYLESVKILLQSPSVDVTIKTRTSLTALDLANQSATANKDEIITLVRKALNMPEDL